ncbi:MAG TPA: DUF1801 domain-containing protein [Kofleriaceae bacterium]|jgi:hypothetical protein|nr:DUF1801 domain-containing protein [Kofleriaceae bacterium]
MATRSANTVDEYLAALPADRRAAIAAVRDTINRRIPRGYEHGMLYGGPAWYVPRSRLAETYNGQPLAVAVLGSQKNHMALYLMTVYGDSKLSAWFRKAYAATGKKLDMGKSCIRFKTLETLALDVVGEAVSKVSVDDYVRIYEQSRTATRTAKPRAAARKPRSKTRATGKRRAARGAG